jgi:hypothetical protein
MNIGRWGTNKYANNTVEIISKIAAVDVPFYIIYYILTNTLIARRSLF